MWQSAFALGQFLSPVVVTFLADRTGGLMHAFVALSGGAVIGLAVVLLAAGKLARAVDPADQAEQTVAIHG
jgi:hypothetical protein